MKKIRCIYCGQFISDSDFANGKATGRITTIGFDPPDIGEYEHCHVACDKDDSDG